MKHIITAFIFTGILVSCNSSDKTNTAIEEPAATETITEAATEINKNLQPIDTDAALIATALMAAPEASRAGCKVIGYNMAGEFVTLREGNNEFIVLADDPKKDGFSAACYHKDLDPFMARGRALKAEGKKHQEIFNIREAEAKAGDLKIPTGGTLHIYYGKKIMYDSETLKVDGARLRYVVYMPFATAASTGLPEAPAASNHPWIMNPGTHRAHIMISPLPEDL
ncbi:hypothetical protein [Winogradskyella sp. UBA3174]|uniref:hypothetical protein n=1 Tax=Winogradskyella sp. UBA3174 TaxID=1947785 RepID=UPI0025E238AB|nr:hypothetical protein [Winogradskyella sp. UBA3174]|tara:strand:- start:40189 stop:40863 length:675 start_codon:yes stop_codon:yes gene_type:complete